jgi:hypothetical protein
VSKQIYRKYLRRKRMYEERYWIGPYGVRVSNKYDSVVAADGGNILYKDGRETEMGVEEPMTRSQWLETYAVEKRDGVLWYKPRGNEGREQMDR